MNAAEALKSIAADSKTTFDSHHSINKPDNRPSNGYPVSFFSLIRIHRQQYHRYSRCR